MEKLLSNEEFNDLADKVVIVPFELHSIAKKADPSTSVDDALDKLCKYWGVIKPILKVAKLVTGKRIDKGIDEFIAVVDKLCKADSSTDKSELLEKFAVAWGIIRPILEAVKSFTSAKVDAIINEVIKIGDLLSKS